jgi:hypothetical protein
VQSSPAQVDQIATAPLDVPTGKRHTFSLLPLQPDVPMSRPIVEELNFQEFKRALDKALAAGTRILPTEGTRWAAYVNAHGVRENNFQAYARGMYESLDALIIYEPAPWGGYYLWSPAEEVVLRWRRPEAGA